MFGMFFFLSFVFLSLVAAPRLIMLILSNCPIDVDLCGIFFPFFHRLFTYPAQTRYYDDQAINIYPGMEIEKESFFFIHFENKNRPS